MTHWRKHMDSRFIGSWDIEGDWTGEIVGVEGGEVENAQGKQKKPMIAFKGAKKKLVANATICKTIAAMYGDDVEKWTGKRVTLYTTKVDAFGTVVEAIRVRPRVPDAEKATT